MSRRHGELTKGYVQGISPEKKGRRLPPGGAANNYNSAVSETPAIRSIR